MRTSLKCCNVYCIIKHYLPVTLLNHEMPPQTLPVKSLRSPFGQNSIGLFDDQSIDFALAITRSDVKNDEDVARAFAKCYPDWNERALPGWDENQLIPSNVQVDFQDWERGQKFLRLWLPEVARFDRLTSKRRAAVLYAVNEMLAIFDSYGCLYIGPTGLELRRGSGAESVLGLCIRSMVRFMVPGNWPPSRLGCCAHPNCKQWFIRPPPRPGSVRQYCSNAHANSARVMQFRKRNKKKAKST